MKERDPGPFQSPRNKWLSRRDLVRGAAGAALGAGLLRSKLAFASDNQDDSSACVSPNPIPGGVAPFAPLGVFIHHNPLNPKNTLDQISDPSQITDFDGFVGLTHIRGGGTGTDKNTGVTARLNFQADMGFSQGTFIATDGQPHRGTFVFVWLDLYTGPVGLATQVHDYNVHIDRNDVFWMIQVRDSAVRVHVDDAHAELHVSNMSVFDDHDIANSLTQGLGFPNPPIPPVFPVHATVSFDIVWDGALATANIRNASQAFEGSFLSTGATIIWTADQAGFRFDSDNPADPNANLISVLGREQNGVFFT